ncbi:MAG: type II toxin-antitoxin system RelE/ParE family toxin [Candidatus Rokuibacteriota bacterium]
MSIRSFRHRGLKRLFEDDERRGVPAGQAQKIADVLAALDTAEEPADVGLFPGQPQGVLERHDHWKLEDRLPLREGPCL